MKLVGIIEEHSPEIRGKKYSDFVKNYHYENKENIINYLQKGITIAVTMNVAFSLIKNERVFK